MVLAGRSVYTSHLIRGSWPLEAHGCIAVYKPAPTPAKALAGPHFGLDSRSAEARAPSPTQIEWPLCE